MAVSTSEVGNVTDMSRTMRVSDSIDIAVSPDVVYKAVSDVTQMPRWSPENVGAEVPEPGGHEPFVGMKFIGSNKRGLMRWNTRCVVLAAEPGKEFVFSAREWGYGKRLARVNIARWEYRFEPIENGTRVHETWVDERQMPDLVAAAFDRAATGTSSFAKFQKGNIRRTLRKLKSELESGG